MKNILVLGMCPLPGDNETQTIGPGKRTWQFVKTLLDHGHHVCLIASRHKGAYTERKHPRIAAETHDSLIRYTVDQEIFENRKWIQHIHDNFRPDVVLGATVYPSYIACGLNTDKPIWADLFGHIMAEAQTKCRLFDDDFYLLRFWNYEQRVIDKADIFSVVSNPQLQATIGELGIRGRLNKRSAGYSFIRLIPCAVDLEAYDKLKIDDNSVIDLECQDDDFIVSWSGGYNTWTDVETLFCALENAMAQNNSIKFLSTGGAIGGHDEFTYPHFLELINASVCRDNFIMKGWIPHELVPAHWRRSHVGINIDRMSYEAVLGSRNRILDWMGVKLPVITTKVCELTEIMEEKKLGLTFEPEKADVLTNLLLNAARDKNELKRYAERAYRYAQEKFTFEATTQPLLEWLENPAAAPDKNRRVDLPGAGIKKTRILRSHYIASLRNTYMREGPIGTVKWAVDRIKEEIIRRKKLIRKDSSFGF